MSILAIILIVLAALLAVLFLGGLVAVSRRRAAGEAHLRARIEAANGALAQAHAEDNGWERGLLERAARDAVASAHPGGEIDALHLVQVIDRPGTEADEAVFRAVLGAQEHTVRLGRRDGAWIAL